jgi:hypothetical protein
MVICAGDGGAALRLGRKVNSPLSLGQSFADSSHHKRRENPQNRNQKLAESLTLYPVML